MALRRPPTHRADAPIVYIDSTDSAWDSDMLDREVELLVAEGKTILDHPFGQYVSGITRYDLDATHELFGEKKSARTYIDEAKEPVKWELHRLTWEQWAECIQSMRSGRTLSAKMLACRYGIKKTDGGGLDIDNKGRCLSDKDMTRIHEIDHGLPERLGDAVLRASRELSDDEKKA